MEPKKTEVEVEAGPKKRLVRVRALRPIADVTGKILNPGDEGDVEESIARDMCKKTLGHFTFSGERIGRDADEGRANLTRAVLVNQHPQA